MFDLDLCSHELKINMDHSMYGANYCTKFGNILAKRLKVNERTTL